MAILTQSSEIQLLATLTPHRLQRYLQSSQRNVSQALKLYVANAHVAAALLPDLHFLEIALRNKIDAKLSEAFGSNWASEAGFISQLSAPDQQFLQKQRAKYSSTGLIANLSFGFWISLFDKRYTHTLWIPHLRKIFSAASIQIRADLSGQLELLRQLRNRIAHHEPIFHLDLNQSRCVIFRIVQSLCPATAKFMQTNSNSKRAVMKVQSWKNASKAHPSRPR